MVDEVLKLEPGSDHVARLARRNEPLRAIIELVWNSIDAEADNVRVEFVRGELVRNVTPIDEVRVVDDGHGISPDELKSTFGVIGGSWKKAGSKTKNGKRLLHGEQGQGRLRAFALGEDVEWVSHAKDATGAMHKVTITGSTDDYRRFPSSFTATPDVRNTGTTFRADNRGQLSLGALDSDQAVPQLLGHFAPLLLNDTRLSITYDGARLDPTEHVADDKAYPLKGVPGTASVRIIEWKSAAKQTPRMLHIGSDGTHFPHEEAATRLEAHYPFTAYVTWDKLGLDELSVLGLHTMAPEPVDLLWKALDETIRQHFIDRRRRQRGEQIKKWRTSGVYPYKGRPANDAEKAERAVFDVISGTLASHIATDPHQAKVTLHLLQGAVRHDPGTLTTILHEVVSLSEEDAAVFTRLLQETSLTAIVRAVNQVADRRKLLEGLNHILFDPDDSKHVGERDHLHKILNGELWVFGEGYNVMRSERSLTDLARTHLKLAGLPDEVAPIRRSDGRTGRTDLHLAVSDKQHDRIRHLVVELKAPHVELGRDELNQVEDYANVVLDNPAFATSRSEWDFILVGTRWDDVARRRVKDGRDDGLYWEQSEQGKPRVRAFVRTWGDIITENIQRLDFLSKGLDLDPSVSDGLRHLQTAYPEFLPPELEVADDKSA
jgi:hypothetical protein